MPHRLDTRRRVALHRFAEFFAELKGAFRERDEVLDQVALALLAREHVLMTGPPGTAKSALSSAVVGRIRCEESGEPSLFARQFTESTVQTDLIGPVNFKTLTETGRTEHFTDEGMLGAIHAFLDEVFDGRDMLLRSTLNVLEERELKHGTKVTKGAIECALMTTNRYLAEVLEDSRETLLAFVDRVAFVNFVPRGFARSESMDAVLGQSVGAHGARNLRAELSIQDLDVLQAMVEQVEVPTHVLVQLRQLVEAFESEQRLAARADPQFVPTRYLSTRTVVRLGKLLRAICVFDKATHRPERPLRVDTDDLGALRLSLLLTGPRYADIEGLLERESDARERRQLKLMQREHELFTACIARLPQVQPGAEPTVAAEHAMPPSAATSAPSASVAAMRAVLAEPGAGDPLRVARDLAARAEALSAGAGEPASSTELASWLRASALRELAMAARLGGLTPALGARAEGAQPMTLDTALRDTRTHIETTEVALTLRSDLLAASPHESHPDDRGDWLAALAGLRGHLRNVWDAAFRAQLEEAQRSAPVDDLSAMLRALEGLRKHLDALDEDLARLDAHLVLGAAAAPRDPFAVELAGPRLRPIVASAYARLQLADRRELAAAVRAFAERLDGLSLGHAVNADDHIRWAAEALLRSEVRHTVPSEPVTDLASYRQLRAAEATSSAATVLAEITLTLLELEGHRASTSPKPTELDAYLSGQDTATAKPLGLADLARIERAVAGLESWWASLHQRGAPFPEALADVLFEERALLRFALECRLTSYVFAAVRPEGAALEQRIAALHDTLTSALDREARHAAQAAWERSLGAGT
jgi:MoxR-like ATPase